MEIFLLIVSGLICFVFGARIGQEIYKDKMEVKRLRFFSIENKRLTRDQAAGATALWAALTEEKK